MKHKVIITLISLLTLSGCANEHNSENTKKVETNPVNSVPSWVLNPTSANGFSASNCVIASGNFSVDRNHAISLARNTLAQNLETKVSVLEKSYQKINNSIDGKTSGTSFEQISKKITNTSIKKSHVEQVSLVEIAGVEQVCALVMMPLNETEMMFDRALPADIDPTDKASLYKEFTRQKVAKALEKQGNKI